MIWISFEIWSGLKQKKTSDKMQKLDLKSWFFGPISKNKLKQYHTFFTKWQMCTFLLKSPPRERRALLVITELELVSTIWGAGWIGTSLTGVTRLMGTKSRSSVWLVRTLFTWTFSFNGLLISLFSIKNLDGEGTQTLNLQQLMLWSFRWFYILLINWKLTNIIHV